MEIDSAAGVELPNVPLEVKAKVPPEMVVPPVYVLAPDKVSAPAPDFVRAKRQGRCVSKKLISINLPQSSLQAETL